jgi:hypothetical protein
MYLESLFECHAGTAPQYLLVVLEVVAAVQIDKSMEYRISCLWSFSVWSTVGNRKQTYIVTFLYTSTSDGRSQTLSKSRAWTVFARSNTGIVGSDPTQGMDVCVRLFYVCVFLCVGSCLATGWSPVQGVLPTVCRVEKLKKLPRSSKRTVDP